MDFPLKNCIVKNLYFSASQVQELLQYPHSLTWVLLDLQLLEKEANLLGEERATAFNLSRDELNLLDKFTLVKRKREWLGGRLAAKHAAAKLLEQVESQKNILPWSSFTIIADKNGRPFLSAAGDRTEHVPLPDISISHSASMAAAMAVHKGYCGIDIQKITSRVIKVSQRFSTRSENQVLKEFFPGEPEAAYLTKLWAAKESLRKVSCMSSLPGFLELELIEIAAAPLPEKPGFWGFIFNWKNPADPAHKKCRVAVTHVEDYVLALTARGDTVS